MRTSLLCSFAVLGCTMLFGGCIIHDDGGACGSCDLEMQELDGAFGSIVLSGSASVLVTVCDDECEPSVGINDDADGSSINTSGGTLTISGSGSGWDGSPAIYVRTPSLSNVKMTGSGIIRVKSLVETSSLSLTTTGSGEFYLRGGLSHLSILSSGSGEIDTSEATIESVSMTISGSSDLKLCVSESLTGTISGSADVDVTCDPETVSVQTSGSGSVNTK